MRILVVEDDNGIQNAVKNSLEAECFSIDVASNGEHGSFLGRTNDYDLIILDYVLPMKNGSEVCKEIRAAGKHTPIIMLTVQSEIKTKVNLLNLGADDYITKPFSFDELIARIHAVLRRPASIEGDILQVADLCLDLKKHRVLRGIKDLYLTRKEYELLEYLVRNRGNVLSRAMIMEHVWDMNADPFSNTLETHILNLRKKIDAASKIKLIHTVPGRGYKVDIRK